MGLGADTIEVFAEAPYRRAAEMHAKDLRRVKAVVELHNVGVPDEYLFEVAKGCAQIDLFEAVREGGVTADQAAWLLSVRQAATVRRPWYVRLALWLETWGR